MPSDTHSFKRHASGLMVSSSHTPRPSSVSLSSNIRSTSRSTPRRSGGHPPSKPSQSRRSVTSQEAPVPPVPDPCLSPLPHEADDDGGNLDEDSLNEVVMAVDIRNKGTVGCSYYVAREEKLYFMEDMKLGGTAVVESRITLLSFFAIMRTDGLSATLD